MFDDTKNLGLPIQTQPSGFYKGFNLYVVIGSQILVSLLILWAGFFPDHAQNALKTINGSILSYFSAWYTWIMALFVVVCLLLALWPKSARLKIGAPLDQPEFSYFSWFSMMFGAGIGVAVLTWSIAEPIYHFQNNPDVIKGLATSGSEDNIVNAFKWSFLHWGFSAWSCYAISGLAFGYFAYRKQLPLTIRSVLMPLFGQRLSGGLGHLIDIAAVVATVLGVAQMLGFGIEQLVSGLHRTGAGNWLLNTTGTASTDGIFCATLLILIASVFSALSGVGKGIKWLSNINMALSLLLLIFILLLGSTGFGLQALASGLIEYCRLLPELLSTVWPKEGSSTEEALSSWQGDWSVFYWAWWIAFAPFVGLFLARISKGRTIREFILGAIFAPAFLCFIWFALMGGTAIDFELNGSAQGAIFTAVDGDKIFALVELIVAPEFITSVFVLIVTLLMTYLITSVDSAILVINTISSGGNAANKSSVQVIFWGVALGLVVSTLLITGGLKAIQTAMVIGALPFSFVMVLLCFSLLKAIYQED